MIVYPAIDIYEKDIVRLRHGDFDQVTQYSDSPLSRANMVKDAGGNHVHVIDLSGAKSGEQTFSQDLLSELSATKLQIQTGGGIRARSDIQHRLDWGCSRVIIGSKAVESPNWTTEQIKYFGADKIILAFDLKKEDNQWQVHTNGWQQRCTVDWQSLIDSYYNQGLKHLLMTDIGRDGALEGPSWSLYADVQRMWPDIQLQVSGGVANIQDVQQAYNLGYAGLICGRAWYENKLDIKQAIALTNMESTYGS
jgi:phosphoribosylformimino-5-aminoimidazole carboxamide ribotide isomerase